MKIYWIAGNCGDHADTAQLYVAIAWIVNRKLSQEYSWHELQSLDDLEGCVGENTAEVIFDHLKPTEIQRAYPIMQAHPHVQYVLTATDILSTPEDPMFAHFRTASRGSLLRLLQELLVDTAQ